MLDFGLRYATASAPATVSNVAVGFDILGFSLTGLSDEIRVERSSERGVRILDIQGDGGGLPEDPSRNTATAGLVALCEERDLPFGLEVTIKKGVPLQSGLGGPAASAVAAIVATSAVLDTPLSLPERFHYALLSEALAAGTPHGDNIAPAMLGGLILVRSMEPFDVLRIPMPHDMGVLVVQPRLEVNVRKARDLLRSEVPMSHFVTQSANLAGFLAGCFRDDRDLIGRSLQDLIVEPQRAHLIPGFADVQAAALKAGAIGCSLSGAGPSIFALHDFDADAEAIGHAMVQAFADNDLESRCLRSPVQGLGAHLLERGPRV